MIEIFLQKLFSWRFHATSFWSVDSEKNLISSHKVEHQQLARFEWSPSVYFCVIAFFTEDIFSGSKWKFNKNLKLTWFQAKSIQKIFKVSDFWGHSVLAFSDQTLKWDQDSRLRTQFLNLESWILNLESWILNLESWILNLGFWILNSFQNFCSKIHWTFNFFRICFLLHCFLSACFRYEKVLIVFFIQFW
jgi:hypothetical protein